MQADENTGPISMHEDTWGKDGPREGCLMDAVILAGLTLLSTAVMAAGIKLGIMAVTFLWSL
jgi:hypothetical protein